MKILNDDKDSHDTASSEKRHSKTWLAMQKYKGTVVVYDKSLLGI